MLIFYNYLNACLDPISSIIKFVGAHRNYGKTYAGLVKTKFGYHQLALAAVDLNGQARGKRIPSRYAAKIFDTGTRMPFSACNVDLLGQDIEDSPLVFNSGDADGALRPTERGFVAQITASKA
jgi:hypothetical protein